MPNLFNFDKFKTLILQILNNLTKIYKMIKQKTLNCNLLYKDLKKGPQIPKNNALKDSSQKNDDSLDQIFQKTQKNSPLKTNNNEQINENDLKQLRTCISNQFRKSNFINISALKNDKNRIFQPSDQGINEIKPYYNLNQTNLSAKVSQSQINKRKMLTYHNRSQSCPFIEPLYIYDNVSTNDGKNEYPCVISSKLKVQKQTKKKISIQHLNKNRNKFNMGGSAQKKHINHNYSNSLTQSSNTVIVHNIPNQTGPNIAPNQNLSSILYKKAEDEEQTKTKRQKLKKQQPQKHEQNTKMQKRKISLVMGKSAKNSQGKSKNMLKKTILQIKPRQDFLIKTKLQQRIQKYLLQQEIDGLKVDSQKIAIKQVVIQKILKTYEKQTFFQKQINFQNQSVGQDDLVVKDCKQFIENGNITEMRKNKLNNMYTNLIKKAQQNMFN